MMFRHDAEAAFAKRFYAVLTAQSGNAVTAADDALLLQYPPRLVGAVCLARLQMQGSDRPQQFSVFYSVTALGPAQPVVKAAAGHAQGPAQPGNLELLAMPPNERVLHGSSRAKYAAAFFRMSRSSVTFSSSRFRRATSLSSDAVLRPGPRKAFSPLLPSYRKGSSTSWGTRSGECIQRVRFDERGVETEPWSSH